MTEIDFAYFNYEHVLFAYLPCLFLAGAGRPASRLVTGLSRVAATVAGHVDDLVSSRGWESWDVEFRPAIPEGMPVLADEDLRFDDGGVPRPATIVNRWPREAVQEEWRGPSDDMQPEPDPVGVDLPGREPSA